MLVAILLCSLMLAGLVLFLGLILFSSAWGWSLVLFLLSIAAMGYYSGGRDPWVPWRTRYPTPEECARLEAAVTRMALIADIEPPYTEVRRGAAPLSWTTALRRRDATLNVTTGLL